VELTLYTEGYFDAAHYIERHAGKCSRLHGHTWKICVWIKGDDSLLDTNGILWDFGNLKEITDRYDHQTLNEIIPGNPTAELLVKDVYERLKRMNTDLLFRVRVYENTVSRESWCEGGDFS
jgi:6-pyruvoyltetrahydropterin/6-carboxytetrahydropterin synthase